MVKFNGTFSDRRNSKSNAKKPLFFCINCILTQLHGGGLLQKKVSGCGEKRFPV